MRHEPAFAAAIFLLATAPSCATRWQLCEGAGSCGASRECVAGLCQGPASALVGSRRLVLPPVALSVIERGEAADSGKLPRAVTLGRAGHAAGVLMRFELPLDRSATILRASLLVDRSPDAPPDDVVALHAERVIGPWDPGLVSWRTAPAVQDLRSPRTRVGPAGPSRVRIDVTDLARRWLARDAADHGVLLVAEDATARGVALALGSSAEAGGPREPADLEDRGAPRLELYVR